MGVSWDELRGEDQNKEIIQDASTSPETREATKKALCQAAQRALHTMGCTTMGCISYGVLALHLSSPYSDLTVHPCAPFAVS